MTVGQLLKSIYRLFSLWRIGGAVCTNQCNDIWRRDAATFLILLSLP